MKGLFDWAKHPHRPGMSTPETARRMRDIANRICGVRVYDDAVTPDEVAGLLRRGADAIEAQAAAAPQQGQGEGALREALERLAAMWEGDAASWEGDPILDGMGLTARECAADLRAALNPEPDA